MTGQAEARIEINREECTGCGICLGSCKREALTVGTTVNRFGVYPMQHRDKECQGCATCYYLCPEPGAITLYN